MSSRVGSHGSGLLDVFRSLRRLAGFLRPYRVLAVLALGCSPLAAAVLTAGPLMAKAIIDVAIPHKSFPELCLFVGGTVFLMIASSAIHAAQGLLGTYMSERVGLDIRTELFARLAESDYTFFQDNAPGAILNRLMGDVDSVSGVLMNTAFEAVANICTIGFSFAVIFAIELRLGVIAVVAVPLMLLPLWKLSPALYSLRRTARETRDTLSDRVDHIFSAQGFLLMKLFGRERLENQRLRADGEAAMNTELRVARKSAAFGAALSLASLVGPIAIWFFGGFLALEQSISIGALVAFMAYVWNLYTPASNLISIQPRLASAAASIDRVMEYYERSSDPPTTPPAPLKSSGNLDFLSVSFAYPTGAPPVHLALDDVTLSIRSGEHVAIVGPSGAGKSTIATLLGCFSMVTSGEIRLDGVDISLLDPRSVRQVIGVVGQHTVLSHDSVLTNIAYGDPEASKDEIFTVARLASVHDRIAALPDGYDTIVGVGGYKLSGGERQRIAIARMLLRRPAILILDEATSALDVDTERSILSEVAKVMYGSTLITIAHRLSSVALADRIFYMRQGKVVEVGTPEQLLRSGGAYANFYYQQTREKHLLAHGA